MFFCWFCKIFKNNIFIEQVWFVTPPRGWCITWLCGWGSLILSHHPAKFGIHRSCDSGDITSVICYVTAWSMCHVTLWVEFLHPKSLHCKVWDHRFCEKGIVTLYICHVTTISKCHATLWVGSSHTKLPPCYVWSP